MTYQKVGQNENKNLIKSVYTYMHTECFAILNICIFI